MWSKIDRFAIYDAVTRHLSVKPHAHSPARLLKYNARAMIADPRAYPGTDAELQLTPDGNLRHLLTLKGLDRALLVRLLDDAETFLSPAGALRCAATSSPGARSATCSSSPAPARARPSTSPGGASAPTS